MAMEAANHLRRVLFDSKYMRAFGAWQMMPGRNVSRSLCQPGMSWVLIDCEHGNIDDGAMHEAVAAIASTGSASPIVRITAGEAWMVKRALDAGAHGIMVPLVNTAEDARKLVSYTKFPPMGIRGYGSPFPMGAFGNPNMSSADYLNHANDNLLTVVQIETKEALSNVDKIAAVDGVDVLFVGPFDLGNSIGYPVGADGTIPSQLSEAIDKIFTAANGQGKKTGIFCVDPEQANKFATQGFNMISIIADIFAIRNYLKTGVRKARAGYMDPEDEKQLTADEDAATGGGGYGGK